MSRIDALGMIGIFVLLGGILFSGGIMETTPRMRESQSVSIIFFPPIILIQQMPANIIFFEDVEYCRDNGIKKLLLSIFEDADVFKTSGKD